MGRIAGESRCWLAYRLGLSAAHSVQLGTCCAVSLGGASVPNIETSDMTQICHIQALCLLPLILCAGSAPLQNALSIAAPCQEAALRALTSIWHQETCVLG